MPKDTKIAVTGIAGRIGRIVHEHLKHSWGFSGVDLRPVPGLPIVIADINDQGALMPVFQDAYAVLHLAANPNEKASWSDVIGPNILGVKSVFEAARYAGVKKIVFASSNHVTGLYEQDEPYRSIAAGRYQGLDPDTIPKITHTMPIRPDGPYGVSKAFGEALGRYYAEVFAMQVICLRIGTVNLENRPRTAREYATLLAHQDLVTLIEACLKNQDVPFDVFYGVSANKWSFWDIIHARDTLGWMPREDAEQFRT